MAMTNPVLRPASPMRENRFDELTSPRNFVLFRQPTVYALASQNLEGQDFHPPQRPQSIKLNRPLWVPSDVDLVQ